MADFIQAELTSIALCWSLDRPDGAGIAVTSHDAPLVRDGVIYEPAPGIVPASVIRNLGLDPHSAEVAGALDAAALHPRDLALGRWDGGRALLIAMDWQDETGTTVQLIQGELGSVTIDGDGFSAELLGAASGLDGKVCPATSRECRAAFGDKRCRVDLAGRTTIARVVESSDGEHTLDQLLDERFVFGRLRYLSGANCGLTTVITRVDGSTLSVRDLPRAAVETGSRVELREGCDKAFETCAGRFSNAANFRGEPHLPGTDLLTRYPGV